MLINRESLRADPRLLEALVSVVSAELPFFCNSYPQFCTWMVGKVLPGLYAGERTVVIRHRGETVAGFMIVKHTEFERKICTLRVREPFQRGGLGVRLFEQGFELLGTSTPLVSVAGPNLARFTDLFNYFGFRLAERYEGKYVPSSVEFAFNGLLSPEHACDALVDIDSAATDAFCGEFDALRRAWFIPNSATATPPPAKTPALCA